jgi:cold shock protein
MTTGTCKLRVDLRGFGFISSHEGGDDVFVHASAISDGRFLEVGDRVTFELVSSSRGPKAVGVARLQAESRISLKACFLLLSSLLGIREPMSKAQKRYVVVGETSDRKPGRVFQKMRLPDGETTWVMNKRIYRRALGEADRTLRDVIVRRKTAQQ